MVFQRVGVVWAYTGVGRVVVQTVVGVDRTLWWSTDDTYDKNTLVKFNDSLIHQIIPKSSIGVPLMFLPLMSSICLFFPFPLF